MYAHYFKQGKNHMLIISKDTRPNGETIIVASKKEAKDKAKQLNAEKWNF